jgi:hypothetical protein
VAVYRHVHMWLYIDTYIIVSGISFQEAEFSVRHRGLRSIQSHALLRQAPRPETHIESVTVYCAKWKTTLLENVFELFICFSFELFNLFFAAYYIKTFLFVNADLSL